MFVHDSDTEGFTLIELMVAISIFSLAIAGAWMGLNKGYDLVEASRQYTRASQILQSEMEVLRNYNWNEVDALPASELLTVDPVYSNGADDMYSITRTVSPVNSTLKQVGVTLSYVNRRGRTVVLKYVSFYAQDGVNDYYYRTI